MKKILVAAAALGIVSDGALAGWRPLSKSETTIENIGTWTGLLITFSGLAYSTMIQDWQGDLQWGLSVGSTVATTEILKYVVREDRPNQAEDAPGFTFPSGHASFAFAGAGYWERRYGWYVGAPMYAAATFVGYSRVHANRHHWWDVVAGAGIGIGFNYLFTTRYMPSGINASVSPTDGGAMLRFNTRF